MDVFIRKDSVDFLKELRQELVVLRWQRVDGSEEVFGHSVFIVTLRQQTFHAGSPRLSMT